ncbi:MAG: hypothetical protein QM500_13465, partial [Methylococcales bacterium]
LWRFYSFLGKKKYLAINKNTDIVIEGFPRSANTFAVVAFEKSQKTAVSIAHHLHVPSQILQASKLEIPTIVLIREPVAAICSFVIREPHISLKAALNDYITFYNTITPVKESFVIAKFEDVTSDYGKIINEVNIKFGTNFSLFNHKVDSVNDVFSRLDSLEEEKKSGTTNETKVARPSNTRKEIVEKISKRLTSEQFKKPLATAIKLYNKFLNTNQ